MHGTSHKGRCTSKTGTLNAASSLCRVAAARLLLQLLMNLRGGGLEEGKSLLARANSTYITHHMP